MKTAIAVSLIIFAGVCIIAYLSLWYAIDDVKNSLDYIKSTCNNDDEIKWSVHILRELISKLHKEILIEITCLATKNNEDIKRMNDGYVVGDVLRFDGTRWCVFSKDTLDDGRTRWKLFNENGEEYRIYTDDIPVGIEFLGHKDLSFD